LYLMRFYYQFYNITHKIHITSIQVYKIHKEEAEEENTEKELQ